MPVRTQGRKSSAFPYQESPCVGPLRGLQSSARGCTPVVGSEAGSQVDVFDLARTALSHTEFFSKRKLPALKGRGASRLRGSNNSMPVLQHGHAGLRLGTAVCCRQRPSPSPLLRRVLFALLLQALFSFFPGPCRLDFTHFDLNRQLLNAQLRSKIEGLGQSPVVHRWVSQTSDALSPTAAFRESIFWFMKAGREEQPLSKLNTHH